MAAPTTELETAQRLMIQTLIDRLDASTAGGDVTAAEAEVDALRSECAQLEDAKGDGEARKAELEKAKTECERSLVALPAEIATLRDSITVLEGALSDLQPALTTLQREQTSLTGEQERLKADLAGTETKLKAQRSVLEETRARVDQLTASTAAARSALVESGATEEALAKEEVELETGYAPLMEELERTQGRVGVTEARVSKLRVRRDALVAELDELREALSEEGSASAQMRKDLSETRAKIEAARRERDRKSVV